MCDEWRASYEAFLRDMGPRPAGHTIERRDNDVGYTPENCRWATRREQVRNRRNSRHVMHDGKKVLLVELAESIGGSYDTIRQRLDRGWSVEAAIADWVT